MIVEDSRNALFVEPGAFIQSYQKADNGNKEKKGIKKIVFQEPYDCLPNFYINNNFKKGNCDCVPKPKPKQEKKQICSPFDLKSLAPLLGSFNKGVDFGKILSLFSGGGSNSNSSNLLTNLLSNKNLLSNVLSIFNTKKTNASSSQKKDIKTTDIPIKDYTRVD